VPNICRKIILLCVVGVSGLGAAAAVRGDEKPQYQSAGRTVPAARADEPKLEKFSLARALEHLDDGAIAWSQSRKCVSCHTNGSYMVIRPALTAKFGKPADEMRAFFEKTLQDQLATDRAKLKESTRPAQVIYVAAGLAEWDAHVTRQLSPETKQALALMFEI
jgi:hypothetical protein